MNSHIKDKKAERIDKLLANMNCSPDNVNRMRFFFGLLEPDNVDEDLRDDEASLDKHENQ